MAGSMDLLSVLQLQAGQIGSQADLIKLRNAQLANRINLHLALGGSFNSSPATTPPAKKPQIRAKQLCPTFKARVEGCEQWFNKLQVSRQYRLTR